MFGYIKLKLVILNNNEQLQQYYVLIKKAANQECFFSEYNLFSQILKRKPNKNKDTQFQKQDDRTLTMVNMFCYLHSSHSDPQRQVHNQHTAQARTVFSMNYEDPVASLS